MYTLFFTLSLFCREYTGRHLVVINLDKLTVNVFQTE